jgi:lipopolysaccharide/colanic/teichoic acid biosynthesis glycosyltransferase
MKPETRSSAGEARTGRPDWSASIDHPARETDLVDTTTESGTTRSVPLPIGAAPPLARPRPVNGSAHPGAGTNGHTNGHARPRAGAHGVWNGVRASIPGTPSAHVLPFEAPRQEGLYLRFGKRMLDLAGSAVALVLSVPVIAALAVLIKLESRGPVFYRSVRIGRGGRPFVFYKLRSMVKDAERTREHIAHMNECDGPVFKIERDPRITRIGRLLRSSSLDELPQFYNVLVGDMSLVGPRPPIPEEVAQYEPWQLRRLDVRPGITCLWQISGRSRIGFQEWMRLDLEYIRHQSLSLDLKILVRTLPAVLSREGAY